MAVKGLQIRAQSWISKNQQPPLFMWHCQTQIGECWVYSSASTYSWTAAARMQPNMLRTFLSLFPFFSFFIATSCIGCQSVRGIYISSIADQYKALDASSAALLRRLILSMWTSLLHGLLSTCHLMLHKLHTSLWDSIKWRDFSKKQSMVMRVSSHFWRVGGVEGGLFCWDIHA